MSKVIRDIVLSTYPPNCFPVFEPETNPLLYDQLDNGVIKCKICKRYCEIPPGKHGYCFARENKNGGLISRVYGALASLCPSYSSRGNNFMMDVASFYCNFKCRFCFSHTWLNDKKELPPTVPFKYPFGGFGNKFDHYINQANKEKIVVHPSTVIEICKKQHNMKHIQIGRSEPTVNFEFFWHLANLAQSNGIDVSLYTNGYSTDLITEIFSIVMSRVIVGIKCYWDQDGYDKVVSPFSRVDVNEILNTILDFRRYGANYSLNILADGLHGDPQKALQMFRKLKKQLPPGEVEILDICITPVVQHSLRAVVNLMTNAYECDYLNVRPGDIIGAIELEMELKKMGFKNAHTQYSIDYKKITGVCPKFFPEESRGGILDQFEKENAGNDIKSYVYYQTEAEAPPAIPEKAE